MFVRSQRNRVVRRAPDRFLVNGHVRAVRHVGRDNRFAGQTPAVMATAAAAAVGGDVLVASAGVAEQFLQADDG